MAEYAALLQIAKDIALDAIDLLLEMRKEVMRYEFHGEFPREVKASADRVLEEMILARLIPAGLPILSEEVGEIAGDCDAPYRWVIDPLDGTMNYVRDVAPCAVSIALCQGDTPIFGVIAEYPSKRLAWGGKAFGAFLGDLPIHVSNVRNRDSALLCTGFPARFGFSVPTVEDFLQFVSSFNKVRMLGAASLSLLQVAKGSADAYMEKDIMVWDVAAGLALVEGAGGCATVSKGRFQHSYDVFASNGALQ